MYDSEEGAVVLNAPKVYYLDAIVRIACASGVGEDRRERVQFEAFRVVLDKQGIVRLDEPIPRGRYVVEDAVA